MGYDIRRVIISFPVIPAEAGNHPGSSPIR